MINKTEINQYISHQNPIVAEVFNKITCSKSELARRGAILVAENTCKQILENHFPRVTERNNHVDDLCSRMSIEEFFIFAESEYGKLNNSWQRKLLKTEPFAGIALRATCYIYELNYDSVSKLRDRDRDSYEKITEGILLAGIYLNVMALELESKSNS